MRRPPAPVVLGLALVVVLVVLVGAVVLGRDDGPSRGPDGRLPAVSAADAVAAGVAPAEATTVVVGDSVVDQSADEIGAALDAPVSVIGLPGYRTDDLLPSLRDALDDEGPVDVAVVMAGYNDVWQRTERQAPVDELMAAMARSAACPIWVLVPTKGPWDRDRAEAFDRRVQEEARAAGVAVETGWRDAVDAGPGPTPDDELVSSDLVHPTAAGEQEVAEVMAAAVARHCG